MNIKNIKALAEIVSQNRLTKLEVCDGDIKICLEKEPIPSPIINAPFVASEKTEINDDEQIAELKSATVDFNNIKEVKAPIVGVFYSAPAPDSDPFVTMGSKVKKGDVLCIIEAMKLMNEITAECDGEIIDICVKNGDIAEFGQVLFKIF